MADKKPISLSSLSSLRQSNNASNSLAQLKQKMQSNPPKLSSLASLATSKPLLKTQPLPKPKTSLAHLLPTRPSTPNLTTPNLTRPADPLYAAPSAAGQFLFEPQPSTLFDVRRVFQTLPSSNTIQPFAFDQPSPDDIVLLAQAQRGGHKK